MTHDPALATTRDERGPGPSIYEQRGRVFVADEGPETCFTASIETVDDDRASSLIGVLPPS